MNTYKKPGGRVLWLTKYLSTPLALLTFALLLPVTTSGAQQPDSSLATSRAQHLRHGINLSEWFAQVYDPKGYTKEHFDTWNTAQDIALIKAMDFDHVRLSVNPQPMFRRRQADRIPPEYRCFLDAALRMILDQRPGGRDRYPSRFRLQAQSRYRRRASSKNSPTSGCTSFKHYSTYDPNLRLL